MQLNEDFLHYIWQYRLLSVSDLYCSGGEKLTIIEPGERNRNAGPDFSLSRLKIGTELWVGNVEIHLKASDWLLHGHHHDKLYDSVVLHAVYEADQDICRTDGTPIPVLVLKELIPEKLFANYGRLLSGKGFIPCSKQIGQVERQVADEMIDRVLKERFRKKSEELQLKTNRNRNDWNGTFYYLLMRSFGFKINAVPFEILADALPYRILALHRDNPLQVNALLFGIAGFLEGNFKDDYPIQLQAEYQFLKKKYNLTAVDRSLWKFMRIHPQNFPLLRIAQVASLFSSYHAIFASLLRYAGIAELKKVFSFTEVHPYWSNHSHFDKMCKIHPVAIGKRSAESLIINTVCLLFYCYGNYIKNDTYAAHAFSLLKAIPSEHNSLLLNYRKAGLKLHNAFESQAVLQLNKFYCERKKCLDCRIGMAILGREKNIER